MFLQKPPYCNCNRFLIENIPENKEIRWIYTFWSTFWGWGYNFRWGVEGLSLISGWFLLIFELSSVSRIGLKKSGAKILNINEVTVMSKKLFFWLFTNAGRDNFNSIIRCSHRRGNTRCFQHGFVAAVRRFRLGNSFTVSNDSARDLTMWTAKLLF